MVVIVCTYLFSKWIRQAKYHFKLFMHVFIADNRISVCKRYKTLFQFFPIYICSFKCTLRSNKLHCSMIGFGCAAFIILTSHVFIACENILHISSCGWADVVLQQKNNKNIFRIFGGDILQDNVRNSISPRLCPKIP